MTFFPLDLVPNQSAAISFKTKANDILLWTWEIKFEYPVRHFDPYNDKVARHSNWNEQPLSKITGTDLGGENRRAV